MRVIRRKSWRRKGKKKKITGQRRKAHRPLGGFLRVRTEQAGRVNVMGGLKYHDKKRICYFIEKGESETFYKQINNLNKSVKKERIDQGNKESDFAAHGPRMIVILDNASFHKKKEIIDTIEEKFDRNLETLSSDVAKASEIAHAISHEISERETENPVFYAFYQLLEENEINKAIAAALAPEIEKAIAELIVIDWVQKEDVQREMRKRLRRLLMAQKIPRKEAEPIILKLMDVARVNLE